VIIRFRSVATIMMIFTSVLLAASHAAAQTAPLATLTGKQQRVLDYMLNDWNKQMRITGVELAMQNVGGQYSPDDRYAIGVFLRNNPRLHRTLRTFGWETAALTPTEKLIARIVSRAERENQPPPTRQELARILDVSPDAVSDALKMLERFGIMRPDPAVKSLGYRMAEDRYEDWEGAMRITFMNHRVQVEGEKPFEVF
jgi:DNA-binding CsgD family transcriptional regulator